jgi:GNAT superfamily N-acetyltransferase
MDLVMIRPARRRLLTLTADEAVVRPAAPADLPEILEVQERASRAALADLYPPEHPLPAELIRWRWRRAFESPGNQFSVAECAGRIVGVCQTSGPWIHAMQVLPEAWGTGVAAGLHRDALTRLRTGSEPEGLLRCLAENHRAKKFWAKHGWQPVAGAVGRQQDPPHLEIALWSRAL